MLLRNVLAPGILLPVVTTAAALGALLIAGHRRQGLLHAAAGLSVALGFFTAFVAISGWPRWPPVEATQRLALAALAIGLLCWSLSRWWLPRVEGIFSLATFALLFPLLLQALIRHTWSRVEALLWVIGLVSVSWALTAAFRVSLTSRSGSAAAVAIRLAVVGGLAVLLGLSNSLRLAQLTGALACSLAAVEALERWRGRIWHRADALVLTVVIAGLLTVGYFYADLRLPAAVLALSALLLLALPDFGRWWVQLTPLVPLALALALSFAEPSREELYWESYGAAAVVPADHLPDPVVGAGSSSGKTSIVAQ